MTKTLDELKDELHAANKVAFDAATAVKEYYLNDANEKLAALGVAKGEKVSIAKNEHSWRNDPTCGILIGLHASVSGVQIIINKMKKDGSASVFSVRGISIDQLSPYVESSK